MVSNFWRSSGIPCIPYHHRIINMIHKEALKSLFDSTWNGFSSMRFPEFVDGAAYNLSWQTIQRMLNALSRDKVEERSKEMSNFEKFGYWHLYQIQFHELTQMALYNNFSWYILRHGERLMLNALSRDTGEEKCQEKKRPKITLCGRSFSYGQHTTKR